MDRDKFLASRKVGIGGSDAPAVLGLSPWRTPLDVYLDKTGQSEPNDESQPMRWGTLLEPVIRQEYAERTGRSVALPESIVVHPKHDWMIGYVDGVTDDGRLVEIKTARSSEGWGEPGTDEVPMAYLIQVQHYLAVTALSVADVAVLIGGSDFRLYEVPADAELQQMIVEREAEFWKRVQERNPPDPVSLADVQRRFGRASKAAIVNADDAALQAVYELRVIRERIAELQAREDSGKAFLMKALGENDTLVDSATGATLATWKAAKAAQRFDSAAFKAAHPDLYSAFLKSGEPSRRFLLKD